VSDQLEQLPIHRMLIRSVPINTVNRQCSSGLTAVAQIANEIKSGEIDIGIGEHRCSSLWVPS